MQLPADTELAQAVEDAVRHPAQIFEVDWGRDGTFSHELSDLSDVFESASLNTAYQGSLPQETTLVEGYSANELTVTLAGKRKGDSESILGRLSSWRSDSPLFGETKLGVQVRWRVGFRTASGATTLLDIFNGWLIELSSEMSGDQSGQQGQNRVTMVCSDMDDIQAPITLPQGGTYRQMLQSSSTLAVTDYRINSQWVIDYILRQNQIYQSPPVRSNCMYSATGHGSMIPEVGYHFWSYGFTGVCTANDPVVVPGRWGLAYNGTPRYSSRWIARMARPFTAALNSKWKMQLQAWVGDDTRLAVSGSSSEPGALILMSSGKQAYEGTTVALLLLSGGGLQLNFYNGTSLIAQFGGPTLSGAQSWRDIQVTVTFGATLATSSLNIAGTVINPANLTGLSTTPSVDAHTGGAMYTGAPVPVQCIQVWDCTLVDSPFYDVATWVPQCDLDPGINEVTHLPEVEQRDSWDLLKEVVSAEFGVVGRDESGRFYFRNRDSIARGTLTTEKTVADTDWLSGIKITERVEGMRNVVVLSTTPRWAASKYETVFNLENWNEWVFPQGYHEVTVSLERRCRVYDFNATMSRYSSTSWDASPPSDGYVVTDSVTNADVTSGVAVAIFALPDHRTVLVQINNASTSTIRFGTTGGNPGFRIMGLVPYDESIPTISTYQNDDSVTRVGKRTYEIPSGPWSQRSEYLGPLAQRILKDLKRPLPVMDAIPMRWDPRLQLGDTIEANGAQSGFGGPILTTLAGQDIRYDQQDGLSSSVTLRPFAFPGRWILGHPVWSVLGETTIPG